jgi:hypothetical protein
MRVALCVFATAFAATLMLMLAHPAPVLAAEVTDENAQFLIDQSVRVADVVDQCVKTRDPVGQHVANVVKQGPSVSGEQTSSHSEWLLRRHEGRGRDSRPLAPSFGATDRRAYGRSVGYFRARS